jgi:hypothetical protein
VIKDIAIAYRDDENKAAEAVRNLMTNLARLALSTGIEAARLPVILQLLKTASSELERQSQLLAGTDATRTWATARVFASGEHAFITSAGVAITAVVMLLDVAMVLAAATIYAQLAGAVASFSESAWYAVPFVFVVAGALVGTKVLIDSFKTDSRRRIARQCVLVIGLALFFAGFLPAFGWVFNIFNAALGSWQESADSGHLELAPAALGFVPAVIMVWAHIAGAVLVGTGIWLGLTDLNGNHVQFVVRTVKYKVQSDIVEKLRDDVFELAKMAGTERAAVEQINAAIVAFVEAGVAWFGALHRGVIGIIGIILLIGIVKKNGIMLVDFAIVAERDRNMPPIAAIREACLLRFRPILMTTAAAMLAGLPMMFGNGTGSELRHPLGYSMVGGLALSQLLTLYTTPVVYLYLARLQAWVQGRKIQYAPAAEEPIHIVAAE